MTRMGLTGWISGRKSVMWQKPGCFIQGLRFDAAKTGRGRCKLSGSKFEKGETQLVLNAHNTDVRVKLGCARHVFSKIHSVVRSFDPTKIAGYDELASAEMTHVREAMSGLTSTSKRSAPSQGTNDIDDDIKESEGRKKKKITPPKISQVAPNMTTCPRDALKLETLPSDSWNFKVVSWNVDGLRAAGRVEGLKKIIKEQSPDLIVLQETKLQTKHAKDDFANFLSGYDCWWFCSTAKKGYSGTAALTKKGSSIGTKIEGKCDGSVLPKLRKSPFEVLKIKAESHGRDVDRVLRIRFGTGDAEADAEGRSITVEYETFIILALYVPNSGQGLKRIQYRINVWDKHLQQYVDELETETGKPVIVTGDLNVAHRDVDIWNFSAKHISKQPGCTALERESFTRWLDGGRVDAFRAQHGGAVGQFTYWSSRAKNRKSNKGLRLDYFVCPRRMVDEGIPSEVKVHGTWIIEDGFGGSNTAESRTPSDHCPVACVLKRGKGGI